MKSRLLYLGVGIAIGLSLLLVGWQLVNRPYTYQGSLIDPPVPAADFKLTDQNGQPYQLSDHKGKVQLIFFGYTNCPDVCPLTMSEFKKIKASLGDLANEVEFVFITVDPERDTPERLSVFLSNFDPNFIALTGTPAELEPVWKNYGVYQEIHDDGSAAGYQVDHSAITYAIDRQGNWRLTYTFGMPWQGITEDLRQLIKQG